MELREGYVSHIRHHDPASGFTVFSLTERETGDVINCVGTVAVIDEGEDARVTGERVRHHIYGEQIKIATFEHLAPSDEDAMLRYLASGAVKGIGVSLAQKIVDRFGADTFRIFEREPERLAEIRGISERKAAEIHERFAEKQNMRNAIMFLQQYGITLTQGIRIFNRYGENTVTVVQTNPYRLADDISGISFQFADDLARRMGGFDDSDSRLISCMIHVMKQASFHGHAYFPETSLRKHVEDLIGMVPDDVFQTVLNRQILEGTFRTVRTWDETGRELRNIYRTAYFRAEHSIARMLTDIDNAYRASEEEARGRLSLYNGSFDLDEIQAEAVVQAVTHGVFVLTGGPGTGKTTTINAILSILEGKKESYLLAAPTGRAAKRVKEATGREATTIHRLLGASAPESPEDDGAESAMRISYRRNHDNPLEASVIVIDEMSMVDMFLMRALLDAIVPGMTRLILVGDANQLPSVGPGNVFRDILASEAFATVRLTKIFRQEEASEIVINAHRINRGELPVLREDGKDFLFLRQRSIEKLRDEMVKQVRDILPKRFGVPAMEVQVLMPMRRSEVGSEGFNKILQEALNPASPAKDEMAIGDHVFRVGDKVIQTKNNYALEWYRGMENGTGIFNGEIGVIQGINIDYGQVTVLFDDDRTVYCQGEEIYDLELAYALTIHKSQGSEYPVVVLPLFRGPLQLMNRNLLYTGVTRAVRCAMIIGDENAVYGMVQNDKENARYTSLAQFLTEV